MKHIVLFVLIVVSCFATYAQEVVTFNQTATQYSSIQPTKGNNGIYLRINLGLGFSNPFTSYSNETRFRHFSGTGGYSLHCRFQEKHWVGIGISEDLFESYYDNYYISIVPSLSTHIEYRLLYKQWGNNSLFSGLRVGVNIMGGKKEFEYPVYNINGERTTYYVKALKPYIALETGVQLNRFDIGMLFCSSLANTRPEYEIVARTKWLYCFTINFAYNFRIIKLK